jgi:uncharacterized membrane protein YphA (DoxX/SURF4 family)
LLLRVAVGFAAVGAGGRCLSGGPGPSALGFTVGLVLAAAGASLLVGFLTPLAAVLVGSSATGVGLSWLSTPPTGFDNQPATVLVVMVAAAIALLGPGAYSLDAYLFGRREIIIVARSGTLNRDTQP